MAQLLILYLYNKFTKMKLVKHILCLVILTFIMGSFSQCSSAQKLQKEAPTTFGEVYFQKWVSGMAQGPSGINIFIEIKYANVQLDSVYFRGKGTKLDMVNSNKFLYVGKFVSKSTEIRDVIMHGDATQEFGNKAPEIPAKLPFELAPDECVISYSVNNKTKYFKLTDIKEKESKDHPM